MVGYVDQKSSRGMKKGREVPRKTKAMTGGRLKRVGIWVVLRSFSGSQGWEVEPRWQEGALRV